MGGTRPYDPTTIQFKEKPIMAGNFADSNRSSLRYLLEDANAWGVTPATGAPREMRITGSQLAAQKETVTSEELRSDRMVPNIVEVGASAEGEINFEFSAGSIDDFLAAFLYGLWTRPMSFDIFKGIGVSITGAAEVTIASDAPVDYYFTVGRVVKLEGFKTAANNTYGTVSAVVATGNNTVITLTGAVLTVEAGNDYAAILDANDVLVRATTIRFGTAGASAIDSNGGNLFAAAIAAGQISVGQKLHIDGLGRETGTVTFTGVPAAGTRITISDGEKRKGFQFGGVILPGYVDVAPGAALANTATNLAAAIMLETVRGNLKVKATSALGVVTLTNVADLSGGAIVEEVDTGAVMTVVNFAGGDDTLRGVVTVTSIANDVIGITPAPTTNPNTGAAKVVIKGSMIRNPSKVQDFVRQSFTVETSFEDVDRHFVATGLRVGQFELNVNSGEISTGNIQLMGRAMERRIDNTSKLRNAPYKPKIAPAHEIMNATSNVGELSLDGRSDLAFIQSITLSGDASLREQRAVGHKYAVGIGVGRFQLSGSFSAYFETGELFDKFVNHDTIKLSFYYKDLGLNRYDFTIPAIKLTSDPVAPEGIDQDVVENIEWEAQRDPATSCMIQIDRFSSTLGFMA
jgi:hypothetical protein